MAIDPLSSEPCITKRFALLVQFVQLEKFFNWKYFLHQVVFFFLLWPFVPLSTCPIMSCDSLLDIFVIFYLTHVITFSPNSECFQELKSFYHETKVHVQDIQSKWQDELRRLGRKLKTCG